MEFGKPRYHNNVLNMCLTLRSLVSKLVPLYWLEPSVLNSDWKWRFQALQNRPIWSKVETGCLQPMKRGINLQTKLLEVTHTSRLKFFYLGLTKIILKPAFLNVCGSTWDFTLRACILRLNMIFVITSHGTQKYHKCRFLEYKEGRIQLVFGGSFCQLHLDIFTKC